MEYIERLALRTILDFVEDNNKQDKNTDVAEAAQELEIYLQKEITRAEN